MKQARINIIAAIASDGAIGRNGDLLYNVSADLKHFKTITMGKPVIMGRRTFESLPKGALPGRRNIVISRQMSDFPGAESARTLQDAIAMCEGCEDVFVIGGASIYQLAIDIADRIYLTRFDRTDPDADVYFPEISPEKWAVCESSEPETDPKTSITYTFQTLIPNKKQQPHGE